ncbi:hypothetical protein MMC13_001308 [Lambiella insularis]|nr:hypothetical protein [Lambiella insularis]
MIRKVLGKLAGEAAKNGQDLYDLGQQAYDGVTDPAVQRPSNAPVFQEQMKAQRAREAAEAAKRAGAEAERMRRLKGGR